MDGATESGDEERLYGLMEIAERQQAAVQAALDGLVAERAALAREREALARGVRDVQVSTQGAVRSAVAESFAGAATEGVAAVQAATAPLLSRLAGMTEQAGQADVALRGVMAWASWRLLGWMVAAVALLVLGGWLASVLVLWWDTGAIAAAQTEKARLQVEVAAMQANRDEWAKAGFLAKLERCGLKARPCVRINESAGAFGTASDYRVLLEY
ncbi:MAG: hypothetical protein NVS2B11_01640 [Acetobacteraceae bacterium]